MSDQGATSAQAPAGYVYVCVACGKVSRWRYGYNEGNGAHDATSGWDESCSMNCVLVAETEITQPLDWVYPKRVTRIGAASLCGW